MNDYLQYCARNYLKRTLPLCSIEEQELFKDMYSPENTELGINEVVDNMNSKRLDWAIRQVTKTIDDRIKDKVK